MLVHGFKQQILECTLWYMYWTSLSKSQKVSQLFTDLNRYLNYGNDPEARMQDDTGATIM